MDVFLDCGIEKKYNIMYLVQHLIKMSLSNIDDINLNNINFKYKLLFINCIKFLKQCIEIKDEASETLSNDTVPNSNLPSSSLIVKKIKKDSLLTSSAKFLNNNFINTDNNNNNNDSDKKEKENSLTPTLKKKKKR